MGMWRRNSPGTVGYHEIAQEMRDTISMWFNARIQIFNPGTAAIPVAYNPATDTGGEGTPVLLGDSGENGAIVQPLRSPTSVSSGGQATTIIAIRFQTNLDIANLATGTRIRVLNGGEESGLSRLSFALTDPIDASLRWGHIYEASIVSSA